MTEDVEEEIDLALKKLGEEIASINKSNGWDTITLKDWTSAKYDPYIRFKIPSKIALLHSEVSEALEAFRSNNIENFAEEMADVIIRVLDVTHGLNIDVGEAIIEKLTVNRTRGFRHGNKIV